MAAKYVVMRCASNTFQTDKLAVFLSQSDQAAERTFHDVIRPYFSNAGWTYTLHREEPQVLDRGIMLFFVG